MTSLPMNRPSVLVVIPAFNEQATISGVIAGIKSLKLDVLVVDDGSSDCTADAALGAGARVLQLPINLGVGGALRAGFRFAVNRGYEAVIQVDADGQHPLHQVEELCRVVTENKAHLVIGSRYLSRDTTLFPSLPRRIAMCMLGAAASRIAGTKITDSTSGFRVITQPLLGEFARDFPSYYLGDTFEATIAAVRAGYKVMEIPADLSPRLHGTSSTTSLAAIVLIVKVLLIAFTRLHAPLRGPRHAG